ncbi:O-antigen/teichoic acid export membrane protein [Methanolinea mesophila]|uniref:oligosaccharide flippase family protein n=1 Tax=Methanolinea mesophila TaxID=547055 RepID=UPI001AE2BD0C|nr:oligosaccharide flippase family protein [Methanolinea mesophila]MBP1928348.1 O-antigen/teichoic acid export membrane protein [Methanolinea mesophila]
MDFSLLKRPGQVRNYWKNPLYKNSIYIALGRFFDVGIGFFFWTVAARFYSVTDVGLAVALISSLGLVMAFSRLGFDITLIRFMPSHDYNRVFNTCLWITIGAAIVASFVYLAAINFISPDIAFIQEYAVLFIIIAVVNSIVITTGNALLSLRKADLKFIQNIIMGGRLLLLLPFVFLGSLGIFSSLGIAYLIASIYAFIVIARFITISFKIDYEFIRKTFRFSVQNYIASLFQSIPTLIIPIIIVNLISPEDAALYYIAFAVGNLVLIIPDAITTSFFVEGSHGINLRSGAIRTLGVTYAILIPAVLFVVFFGNYLLGLFGTEYLAAFNLLRIIAISSLFVTIYNLFIPLQNIRLRVGGIVILNAIRFGLLIGLTFWLLTTLGVIGAGYAWLITYMILGIGISILIKKRGWI